MQEYFSEERQRCVKVCCHGNCILWRDEKLGLQRREHTSSVFDVFYWNWHRCLPWGVDVQDTVFDSGKKCVAMVTAYYGQKMGENLASRTISFLSF